MGETAVMRQYAALKSQNPDSILFFRMGDFYEMYGDDARLVSGELSLTLGSRPAGGGERIPLCGVPSHAAKTHICALVSKGYRVALCEQQAGTGKGVLERAVVRIVTPGTLLDSAVIEPKRNNYIAGVYLGAEGAGYAVADVSTGVLYSAECEEGDPEDALLRGMGCYAPREVLLSPGAARNKLWGFLRDRLIAAVHVQSAEDFDPRTAVKLAALAWPEQNTEALGFAGKPNALRAAGALLGYLRRISPDTVLPALTPYVYERDRFLQLDPAARDALELFENPRGEKRGSLLHTLDETVTAMGGRTLRSWLEKPLLSPAEIGGRHDAVQELFERGDTRASLRSLFAGLPDMERILLRLVSGQSRDARELHKLRDALALLPSLRKTLQKPRSRLLAELRDALDTLPELFAALDAALADNHTAEEDGLFRPGYDPAYDRARAECQACREAFATLEQDERKRTGIKTLKLGRHKQYGYYIELPRNRASQVPPDYEARQSLSGHERYISPGLRMLEARSLAAEGELDGLETELTERLRLLCAAQLHRVKRSAEAVAVLDSLCSFAETAEKYGYTRPRVDFSDRLEIIAGRHPVVERAEGTSFVPNDTELNALCATAVVTGPNMAGKSTYLRQCALIVLMAQAGSFVPAKEVRLGVVDRVFTRVGASDDIAGGRSTFMVEMRELADILRHATKRSLLILDEIGRGTSTYDGLSVARAALEYAHGTLGAKTLFATHYRELCEMEAVLPGVRNYHITAEKREGEIVFSRRVVPGAAQGSFGVEVAALAGLPDTVVSRARALLEALEAGTETPPPPQEGDFGAQNKAARRILALLRELHPNRLTPGEAFAMLRSLCELAQNDTGL